MAIRVVEAAGVWWYCRLAWRAYGQNAYQSVWMGLDAGQFDNSVSVSRDYISAAGTTAFFGERRVCAGTASAESESKAKPGLSLRAWGLRGKGKSRISVPPTSHIILLYL